MAEDLTKRATSGYLQDTAASSSSFSLSRQASPKSKTVRVSVILAILFRDRDSKFLALFSRFRENLQRDMRCKDKVVFDICL